MNQLSLFEELRIDDIRKEVMQEFPRIFGESYEDWLEVIRIEVDYRIKECLTNKKRPHYCDFHGLKD